MLASELHYQTLREDAENFSKATFLIIKVNLILKHSKTITVKLECQGSNLVVNN